MSLGLSFQEYPEILGECFIADLGTFSASSSWGPRCPRSNSGHKSMELPTRHASVASDAPKGLKAQEMVGTLEQGEEKKQNLKTSMDR